MGMAAQRIKILLMAVCVHALMTSLETTVAFLHLVLPRWIAMAMATPRIMTKVMDAIVSVTMAGVASRAVCLHLASH